MFSRLRSYEAISGDRIFRTPDDAQLLDEDVQEAWSHFAISYWAGRSKMDAALPESWKARGSRQVMTDVLRSRMGAVMTGYATFFNAVFRRAARIKKLQREGRLEGDMEVAISQSLGLEQSPSEAGTLAETPTSEAGLSNEGRGQNSPTTSFSVIPSNIRPLDTHAAHATFNPDEVRNPAAILQAITTEGDARTGEGSSPGLRRKHGRSLVSLARVVAWADAHGRTLDPQEFGVEEFEATGGEHLVFFDESSGRAVKLTKPGFVGA
ncbi:hypothetical protein [Verrucomicrobium spinosum]|uniref:hypothetical protein n=1 Tax=Verrucomicrobium spinosum TaxID=2736 RepID=UPI0001744458|nr:hypothetical protein [Verrucomicrobium spinosum]